MANQEDHFQGVLCTQKKLPTFKYAFFYVNTPATWIEKLTMECFEICARRLIPEIEQAFIQGEDKEELIECNEMLILSVFQQDLKFNHPSIYPFLDRELSVLVNAIWWSLEEFHQDKSKMNHQVGLYCGDNYSISRVILIDPNAMEENPIKVFTEIHPKVHGSDFYILPEGYKTLNHLLTLTPIEEKKEEK